jgi:hypothetical protein
VRIDRGHRLQRRGPADLRVGELSRRPSVSGSSANSRLRVCERESAAPALTTRPSLLTIRSRCAALSDGLVAALKLSSTRVWERFACWPPAPPLVS